MLTPVNGILVIDITEILPCWGYHKIDNSFLEGNKVIKIIVKDTISQDQYEQEYEPWINNFTSTLKNEKMIKMINLLLCSTHYSPIISSPKIHYARGPP